MLPELADVLVLDAVLELHHLTWDEVRALQQARRQERGGFSERLRLDWIEE